MIEYIGPALAIVGSLLAIAGSFVNSVWLDHLSAMRCWRVSNLILFVWGLGFLANLWDGGLSMLAVVVMYLVFFVSTEVGIRRITGNTEEVELTALNLLKWKVRRGVVIDRNHLFSYDPFDEMIVEAERKAQQGGSTK